jgi:hypothetical protein
MAGYAVVMEEIPLSLVFDDAVVCRPSHNRFKDDAFISKRPVGIVSYTIAEQVSVASAVTEIVSALIFVHPTGFKETVWIIGCQGLSLGICDYHGSGHFPELPGITG